MNIRNKKYIAWIVAGIFIGVGAGGWLYIKNKEVDIPADWKTYQNETFGISFRYPSDAAICDASQTLDEANVLDIAISMQGECLWSDQYGLTSGDIFIHMDNTMASGGQTKDNENIANDFYRDFGGIDKSLNPDIGYVDVSGFRAYGGEIRRDAQKSPSEYIVMINQGGQFVSIWDRQYDAHRRETNMIMDSLSIYRFKNSKEKQGSDVVVSDIPVPEGWYAHSTSETDILLTREARLPEIGNTEGYAYGRQIGVSVIKTNGTPQDWIEEQTKPDVLIMSKQWEVINGRGVMKVEIDGEAGKVLNYYMPSGGYVYAFYLYPAETYDMETKTYIPKGEDINTVKGMVSDVAAMVK